VWPTPEKGSYGVNLSSYKSILLEPITDIDVDSGVPTVYDAVFSYGLAIYLAPEFGVEVPASVVEGNNDARRNIMRLAPSRRVSKSSFDRAITYPIYR
jgi:hypothetical protein